MSPDPVVGLLAALGCGLSGLGVPPLLATLPGPPGELAARPGLRWWAIGLSAGAGAVVGGALGPDWALLVLLPLVPVGVALGLVDAHTHLLPTRLIWPSLAGAVVLAVVAALAAEDPRSVLVAAAAGALSFLAAHALWWVRPDGLGYGDVRLAAFLGFALGLLGIAPWLLGFYSGLVLFALVGLARAVRRRERAALREPLPFGPFLLLGALAGVLVAGHLASG